MGQQFLDLEGTKILANKIKEGERKVAFVGSENPDTNGWYKVASQTCSGYGNTNITFMVTSTYGHYDFGILQLQIRSDNTNIHCPRFSWLVRNGFDINHFVIVINGMTWTLYAYQTSSRYGRICFEILSMSSIDRKDMTWTLNFKDNYTKETTVPQANYKSIDINSHHTHGNKAVLDKITEANVKTMNDIASGIGGRNLLIGTSVEKIRNVNNPTNFTTFDPYTTFNKSTLSDLGYSVGDELTISFDWEISQNGSLSEVYGNFRLEWFGIAADGVDYQYLGVIKNPVDTFSSSHKKGKVSLTTKITSNDMLGAYCVRIRIDNSVVNFKVSKMKLEKGSIPTDWSPAPEDMLKKGMTWNELEGK